MLSKICYWKWKAEPHFTDLVGGVNRRKPWGKHSDFLLVRACISLPEAGLLDAFSFISCLRLLGNRFFPLTAFIFGLLTMDPQVVFRHFGRYTSVNAL
jgi:hypothetical protein